MIKTISFVKLKNRKNLLSRLLRFVDGVRPFGFGLELWFEPTGVKFGPSKALGFRPFLRFNACTPLTNELLPLAVIPVWFRWWAWWWYGCKWCESSIDVDIFNARITDGDKIFISASPILLIWLPLPWSPIEGLVWTNCWL